MNSNKVEISTSSWDKRFQELIGLYIPIDLLRNCVYSITLNDPAHNLDHVFGVCKAGLELADKAGLTDKEKRLAVAGCLMHDLGCRYDRDTHHIISFGLVFDRIAGLAPKSFTPDEVKTIAIACLEHRASSKTKPTNKVSEIVALADRGEPDLPLYIRRAIQHRKEDGLTKEEMIDEVHKHLIDKFGLDGYCWESYPPLGLEVFKDQWVVFKAALYDDVTIKTKIGEVYKYLYSK